MSNYVPTRKLQITLQLTTILKVAVAVLISWYRCGLKNVKVLEDLKYQSRYLISLSNCRFPENLYGIMFSILLVLSQQYLSDRRKIPKLKLNVTDQHTYETTKIIETEIYTAALYYRSPIHDK